MSRFTAELQDTMRAHSLYHVQTVEAENISGLLWCMHVKEPVGLEEPADLCRDTVDRLKLVLQKNGLSDSVDVFHGTKKNRRVRSKTKWVVAVVQRTDVDLEPGTLVLFYVMGQNKKSDSIEQPYP